MESRSWKTFVLGLEYSKPCSLSETKGMVVDLRLDELKNSNIHENLGEKMVRNGNDDMYLTKFIIE